MIRDDGHVYQGLNSYNVAVCRPTAFLGGTTNARGDDGGTSDPLTLFTVTGDVFVKLYGVCTTLLASAGGGSLEVGVTGNTAKLIPLTTATAIDADEIWIGTTPVLGAELVDNIPEYLIVNGLDIIETVGTADITSGNVYYVCHWRPSTVGMDATGISIKGNVVANGTQI